MIYLITYNYDYEESVHAFPTREAAVDDIARTFECEEKPDTPAFWEEVMRNYSAGNWKGFQFVTLDPATLKVTDLATS